MTTLHEYAILNAETDELVGHCITSNYDQTNEVLLLNGQKLVDDADLVAESKARREQL